MPIPGKQLLITCAVKSVPYIDNQCPCMHTVSLAEPDPYVGGEGLVTSYTQSCSAGTQKLAILRDVTLSLYCARACLSFQRARDVNDNAFIIVEARDYGNAVKLQSDWCCSVQSAGTTPCIASHQTLSPCIRVWLCETSTLYGQVKGKFYAWLFGSDSNQNQPPLCT